MRKIGSFILSALLAFTMIFAVPSEAAIAKTYGGFTKQEIVSIKQSLRYEIKHLKRDISKAKKRYKRARGWRKEMYKSYIKYCKKELKEVQREYKYYKRFKL